MSVTRYTVAPLGVTEDQMAAIYNHQIGKTSERQVFFTDEKALLAGMVPGAETDSQLVKVTIEYLPWTEAQQ